MITNELFEIILNELAVREGSIFALKIKARTYDNQFANGNDEMSRKEHARMIRLKNDFALQQPDKQQALSGIAERMLKLGGK